MTAIVLTCRLALATVFGVAGTAKLADRQGAATALERFGMPPRLGRIAAPALGGLELAIGVGLLLPRTASSSAAAAIVLLGVFAVVLGAQIIRGHAPECRCFGNLSSAPVGWRTLRRNAFLALVALAVLVGADWRADAWIADRDAATLIVGAVAMVLAVALAGVLTIVFALLRQRGELLQQVDVLSATGGLDIRRHDQGLPVGRLAPAFEAAAAPEDEPRSLADLLRPGRPVVLVFSDPACAACHRMLPEVTRWQATYAGRLTIVVLSRHTGDHGTGERIPDALVQSGDAAARAYRIKATPSAVLISPEGLIAAPMAGGADAIAALVASAGAADPVVEPVVA
jgi:hypothetical protein